MSDTNNILEQIKVVNDFTNSYRNEMKKLVHNVFNAYFESFPEVKTIHWTQYTPYFNDGDECVFTINDINISTKPYNEILNVYDEDEDDVTAELLDALESTKEFSHIKDFIYENENYFNYVFGDGYWIKVSRDGYHIEEYDHE
jgi:hypothetical protein